MTLLVHRRQLYIIFQ